MKTSATLLLTLLALTPPAAAQEQPETKITITRPEAAQTVSGTLEVTATVEGDKPPTHAYVGLDKTIWREMSLQRGQWVGRIDTTMVPNGERTLFILTDNKKVRTECKVIVDNPLQVFLADLHSHTGYSDGTLIPAVAHAYARDVAQLDVFCLTDHLESLDDAEWLDSREAAWQANEDGRFVSFPSLEWTKKWGHLNIYDPKTRHWPEDPSEFYQAAATAGVVTKFNHPGDGTTTHSGLEYSEIGDQTVQLMEVRNPKEEKAYIRALNNGWHLAPEGSDDTHSPNWGNVRSWTGILAPGLSKHNILDALANRRCYSTLDRTCTLRFRVNGAEMGDIVEETVKDVHVVVDVNETEPDDGLAKIELFRDGEVVQTEEPDTASCQWEFTGAAEPGKHYFFVKVTQADGNTLWSAPIWVTVGE